jgi:hypothetical protein
VAARAIWQSERALTEDVGQRFLLSGDGDTAIRNVFGSAYFGAPQKHALGDRV